jgi:hypothetical protein
MHSCTEQIACLIVLTVLYFLCEPPRILVVLCVIERRFL